MSLGIALKAKLAQAEYAMKKARQQQHEKEVLAASTEASSLKEAIQEAAQGIQGDEEGLSKGDEIVLRGLGVLSRIDKYRETSTQIVKEFTNSKDPYRTMLAYLHVEALFDNDQEAAEIMAEMKANEEDCRVSTAKAVSLLRRNALFVRDIALLTGVFAAHTTCRVAQVVVEESCLYGKGVKESYNKNFKE